jgi:hypothetical protein
MRDAFLKLFSSYGKAVARMCPTLAHRVAAGWPCPLVSLTRVCGLENFEGARARLRNSKGCNSIPSRSEKFGETRRSLLFYPCGKGLSGRVSGLICPGAGKQNRGVFEPDIVPFRRIFEHLNSTPARSFSQGHSKASRTIYGTCIQRFRGLPTGEIASCFSFLLPQ